MAIGTGWAEGSWVDAGWVTEAWSDVENVVPIGISGGSNNPHAIRARNWARIQGRNAGRVSESDVNVVLQGMEDEEIITIINSFLKSVG